MKVSSANLVGAMDRLLSSRLVFVFGCLVFRGILDAAYVFFVSDVFGHQGYMLHISLGRFLLSWVVFFLCALLVRPLLLKVSDYFVVLFLLAMIAPMSSMIGLGGYDLFPFFITVSVFIFFRLFQHGELLSGIMPPPKVYKLARGRPVSVFIAFVAVGFLVFWYFASGAFRYFNLDFSKVYDYRAESAELANVGVLAYLNNWVFSVFTIFLMCYALYLRNFVLFCLLFFIQIFFFGVSNHKSVFFSPVMIFGIWFYFRRSRALAVMPFGFAVVVGWALLMYTSFDNVMAGSMFIRRVFFVPSALAFDYFEFFSQNQHVYWSNSILSAFISYPYDLGVAKLIGEYRGNDSAANNGFISSGYAQAGILGVAIYSIILSYFIKVLDVVVANSDIPVWLALCMVLVPLRAALISSDLFTTMLTHGLLVSLLMLILFRDSAGSAK